MTDYKEINVNKELKVSTVDEIETMMDFCRNFATDEQAKLVEGEYKLVAITSRDNTHIRCFYRYVDEHFYKFRLSNINGQWNVEHIYPQPMRQELYQAMVQYFLHEDADVKSYGEYPIFAKCAFTQIQQNTEKRIAEMQNSLKLIEFD